MILIEGCCQSRNGKVAGLQFIAEDAGSGDFLEGQQAPFSAGSRVAAPVGAQKMRI